MTRVGILHPCGCRFVAAVQPEIVADLAAYWQHRNPAVRVVDMGAHGTDTRCAAHIGRVQA